MMKNKVIVSFTDGPKVEIQGDELREYEVQFVDAVTGFVHYKTAINTGCWAQCSIKYLVNWLILVRHGDEVAEYRTDYQGKKVFVDIGSKALGDNIAWMPYVEEFRKRHDAEVHVKGFWNSLFRDSYKELHYLEPGGRLNLTEFYAAFCLGAFDGDYHKNKNHWRLIPLQQIASDILGLEPVEIRPQVARSPEPRPIQERYVAISEFSTFHAKHWLYPGGWQEIVDWLNELGLKVMSVSKERSTLANVIKMNDRPIEETVRNIQHAELFIGLSSGTSVLAWALNVPVVFISGFSLPDKAMKAGVELVINHSVCHGCGNDIVHAYDRGNWNFCPRGRNFECSRFITPDMVKRAVEKALRKQAIQPKVLLLTPHCSTGGGPQYLLRSVEELQAHGHDVAIVEYEDISGHYVVQKNKLKNLCRFYTLNGDKSTSLAGIMEMERPDVVHVQELAERWMDEETANLLYRKDRGYRIVETTHSAVKMEKKHLPDSFAFVSPLHFKQYGDLGIPAFVAEYPIEKRQRPPREMALRKLGLEPGKKHILHVGLFARWKNQEEMFELARTMPQYQFHFVGNQAVNFKDYWEPLMANKPDNCIIWGERHDVDDFYAAMDLFYFPSTMECNPIVIKEALSWGMPVLMRDLEAYCGMYDREPNVQYINGDLINVRWQVARKLGEKEIGLSSIYDSLEG